MLDMQANSKRVSRHELDDGDSAAASSSDDESHVALKEKLHAQLARALLFDSSHVIQTSENESRPQHSVDEAENQATAEEFEFRLFGTSSPVAKIILDDREAEATLRDAFGRRRPTSHYIANPVTDAERRRFQAALITADDIIKAAGQRWWGKEMPWKIVSVISATPGKSTAQETSSPNHAGREQCAPVEPSNAPSRKRHSGKKTRIARRIKDRAAREKAVEEAEKLLSKEELLKAKKKRLNLAKKLRRKAKEKEKKQPAKTEAGMDSNSTSNDGMDASIATE